MKEQAKPVYIAIAAVAAIALLYLLYRNFLAEPPLPHPITREDEMKYKGIQQDQYRKTMPDNYQKTAPRQ